MKKYKVKFAVLCIILSFSWGCQSDGLELDEIYLVAEISPLPFERADLLEMHLSSDLNQIDGVFVRKTKLIKNGKGVVEIYLFFDEDERVLSGVEDYIKDVTKFNKKGIKKITIKS